MASMSAQRASSSLVTPQWTYEVFLSFRGKDTRNGFTSHLYTALKHKGIFTFKDDEKLKRGKSISPELLKAIEESRFAIVILSRNYASSTWCLDELAKVIKCMKETGMKVLPVFYNVEPSDIRKQSGPFAQDFDEHEKHFKNMEKVQIWRDALREVANLSGWHSQNSSESKLIQDIVEVILHESRHPTFFVDKKGLVGVNSRVEKLKSHLAIGSNDVRIIGIKGMGGIGKTTLARVAYNMVSIQFEACSFIANVWEESEKYGLQKLQQRLLKDLLMEREFNIQDVENGALVIKERLRRKKILLVLDGVNQLDQLQNLAGDHDWFGPGSRVIITTRDEHLLMMFKVDEVYEAKGLNYDEARHLFNSKAFGKDHIAEHYLGLSQEFVHYANGLPLAIEVLGSFLYNKSIDEWKSAFDRLKEFPARKILNVLKTSFDGLDEIEKEIFLHVACFFNHMDRDHVEQVLDSLGLYPKIGLRELTDKSLLKWHGDQLWMHDLLQEMGKNIVRQESPKDPGRRSRLWLFQDIDNVLTNDRGTDSIQGIVLELNEPKETHWNSNAFSKMCNLELLSLDNIQPWCGIECLPNSLKYLSWSHYPFRALPSIQQSELAAIRTPFGKLQRLWYGTKYLDSLKLIDVNNCENLIEIPDITGIPNLEKLVADDCTNLCMIHPSIEVHKKLMFLSLRGCKNLINLPRNFEMLSLEILILSGCSKIKNIPEFVGSMERVSKLYLDGTAITELPTSIGNLIGLVSLNLRDCKDLVSLPRTLFNLKLLKDVDLSECSNLEKLPENLGNAESIVKLDASGTAIRHVPLSIGLLKNLKVLSVRECKGLSSSHELWYEIPFYPMSSRSDPVDLLLSSLSNSCSVTRLDLSNCNLQVVSDKIGCLLSLEDLNLSGNNFDYLPECIIRLSNLEVIYLENCTSLLTLPMFPLNINYIWASNCTSLEMLPDKLKPNDSFEPSLHLLNCLNLADNQGMIHILFAMLKALLQGLPGRYPYPSGRYNLVIPGSIIPKWFSHQSMGDEVSVQEPSHLCNEWVGIAVCTVFFSHNHHQDDQIIDHCELGCHLIANGNCIYPLPGISNIAKVSSDHIWLLYLFPQHYDRRSIKLLLECDVNGFNHIGIRIETKGSGLGVKQCGFRLVYMKDIEDLNQTKGQSSNNSEGTIVRIPFGIKETHDGARPSEEASFNSKSDCEESSEYEDCGEWFSDSDSDCD